MNKLYIKDFDGLASEILDKIKSGKSDVAFIGDFQDSSTLIKAFSKFDDVFPYYISLEPIEINGYNREYVVILDECLNVWCEKAFRDNKGYFSFRFSSVYIADDCDEDVIKHVESDDVFEVSYSSDDIEYFDECCGMCDFYGGCTTEQTEEAASNEELSEELSESICEYHNISKTKDGKVAGFTKSWSTEKDGISGYSSYSFFGNDENIVKDIAREFGIKID